MGRKTDFKYLVIGSGPAGLAAATTLAKAKRRVGLIEGGAFGGANLNTRDVPYAVALNFAHTYYRALKQPEFTYQDYSFSFPSIVAHQMKATIESGSGHNPKAAEESGLIYIPGYANFLDAHTVAVGSRQFSADNFILATGSYLNTDSITGLDSVNFLTPETALRLRRLPEAVIVVGGGSTGCEIAEYYATLGAKTLIAEQAPRLLPSEDPEVSEIMTEHLSEDLGVMILTNSKVLALSEDELSKCVIFKNAGEEKMVRISTIILATGSRPNLNYGLENTGVKFNDNGTLKLDRYFATSVKHIFAIGDCALGLPEPLPRPGQAAKVDQNGKTVKAKAPKTDKNGRPLPEPIPISSFAPNSSTERAAYEGRLLANNFVNKSRSLPNYKGFVRLTNTMPAIATFGPTEQELKQRHVRCRKSIVNLSDTPAGKIHGTRLGFVKLLADHSGRIIGGTIVCDDASAMSPEIALAIRHRLPVIELATSPHPSNDYSYAIQLAAQKLANYKK